MSLRALHSNKQEVKRHFFFNIPEIYQNIHLSFGITEVRLMQVLGNRTYYTSLRFCRKEIIFGMFVRLILLTLEFALG